MINFQKKYNELLDIEKEIFVTCCDKLRNNSFIVREKNNTSKELYDFIIKNKELFEYHFELENYIIEEDIGCIGIIKKDNSKQNFCLELKLKESIILFCLMSICDREMKKNPGKNIINITSVDLYTELMKIGHENDYTKPNLINILKIFKKHNLIDFQELDEEEIGINLYPSLRLCLNDNDLEMFLEDAMNKYNIVLDDEKEKDTNEEDN